MKVQNKSLRQINKIIKEISVRSFDVRSGRDFNVLDGQSNFIANLPDSYTNCLQKEDDLRIKKKIWVKEEDDIIIKWTHKNGPKKWRKVAGLIPGRNAKQCRERWHNH